MKTLVSVLALASGIFLIVRDAQWAMGALLVLVAVIIESGIADDLWSKIDDELTREL